MLDVAQVLAATDQRAMIVPRPHPALVTRRILVMERLSGFAFDDVAGMKAAGVDTSAVVRAGMVGFLEGAMLFGVFHGDLHGGNLFVQADGRVALLDYGITGRLDEKRRLAFLRLVIGATVNDLHGQLAALIDLGALPDGTDIDQLILDLHLDGPPLDPLKITPDELLEQLRGFVKGLLAYGARMPKELDALRQGPAVPRRRARARSLLTSTCSARSPTWPNTWRQGTASASPPTSVWTRARWRST